MELIEAIRSGDPVMITAQIFGFLALAASVTTFQLKTYRQIIICQIITVVCFITQYLLLYKCGVSSALSGALSEGICLVRNFFYLAAEKRDVKPLVKVLPFCVLLVIVNIVFWQNWITLLVMIAMVLNTVSFALTNPQTVRGTLLVSSPIFCAYNFFSGSIGGVINEIISMISIVVGLIRYRKKKAAETAE